mgnify:CR=1 FL=1
MNYKIVNGNLLDATEAMICHQVNCQGAMNSGVAKGIRNKYSHIIGSTVSQSAPPRTHPTFQGNATEHPTHTLLMSSKDWACTGNW